MTQDFRLTPIFFDLDLELTPEAVRLENVLRFDQHNTDTVLSVKNRPVTLKTSLYCTSVIAKADLLIVSD